MTAGSRKGTSDDRGEQEGDIRRPQGASTLKTARGEMESADGQSRVGKSTRTPDERLT